MNVTKTALFGGALASAGLANASAQVFEFSYSPYDTFASVTEIGVQAYGPSGAGAYFELSQPYVDAAEAGLAYAVEGWGANAVITDEEIFLSAYSIAAGTENAANATASASAYLSFEEDTDLLITWIFADNPTFAPAIQLFEVQPADLVDIYDWEFDDGALAGTIQFTLEANVVYSLFGFVAADEPGQLATFSATVIPAPPALAAIGVLGLAAARRRR